MEVRARNEARYRDRVISGEAKPNKAYNYAEWKLTPGGIAALEKNREQCRIRWQQKAEAKKAAAAAAALLAPPPPPPPVPTPPAPVVPAPAIAIAAPPPAPPVAPPPPALTPSQRAEQYLAALLTRDARIWKVRQMAKQDRILDRSPPAVVG